MMAFLGSNICECGCGKCLDMGHCENMPDCRVGKVDDIIWKATGSRVTQHQMEAPVIPQENLDKAKAALEEAGLNPSWVYGEGDGLTDRWLKKWDNKSKEEEHENY